LRFNPLNLIPKVLLWLIFGSLSITVLSSDGAFPIFAGIIILTLGVSQFIFAERELTFFKEKIVLKNFFTSRDYQFRNIDTIDLKVSTTRYGFRKYAIILSQIEGKAIRFDIPGFNSLLLYHKLKSWHES
jgi:hypothetical protein